MFQEAMFAARAAAKLGAEAGKAASRAIDERNRRRDAELDRAIAIVRAYPEHGTFEEYDAAIRLLQEHQQGAERREERMAAAVEVLAPAVDSAARAAESSLTATVAASKKLKSNAEQFVEHKRAASAQKRRSDAVAGARAVLAQDAERTDPVLRKHAIQVLRHYGESAQG
jgi:hypothetical protein